jgi:hypothetical protein
VLGDRNSPAYPKDAPILDDVPRGDADAGTSCRPYGGGKFLPSRVRGQAHPGQLRARLIRPKSCRDHLAAEVLLTLI